MYHQLPQRSPSPSSRRTWCRWMTCGGFSADCPWTRWLPAFEFSTMPWFALHPCVSGDPQGLWVWCLLFFTSVSSSVSLSRLICLPTVYLIRHVARTSPSPLPPPPPLSLYQSLCPEGQNENVLIWAHFRTNSACTATIRLWKWNSWTSPTSLERHDTLHSSVLPMCPCCWQISVQLFALAFLTIWHRYPSVHKEKLEDRRCGSVHAFSRCCSSSSRSSSSPAHFLCPLPPCPSQSLLWQLLFLISSEALLLPLLSFLPVAPFPPHFHLCTRQNEAHLCLPSRCVLCLIVLKRQCVFVSASVHVWKMPFKVPCATASFLWSRNASMAVC